MGKKQADILAGEGKNEKRNPCPIKSMKRTWEEEKQNGGFFFQLELKKAARLSRGGL